MNEEQKNKRTDTQSQASVQRITGLHKPGIVKLQKISYETKLNVGYCSLWIFRVQYSDPTGFTTVRQFSFDGSMSYKECLCKLPMTINLIEKIQLRNNSIRNYLSSIKNN